MPPGLTADAIRRGVAYAVDQLSAAGHEAEHVYIQADASGPDALGARLANGEVHCVVVGGGIRLPPNNLALFEALLNVIARAPGNPAIALVAKPDDAPAAVARVLG